MAQKKENKHFAVAAPQGIIVKNFLGSCSPYAPMADGTVQIKVERKTARETSYKTIGYLRGPNTYTEGMDRYMRMSNYAIHPKMISDKSYGKCWATLNRTHSFDSCVFYIIEPVMALSMGFYYYDLNVEENTEYQYKLTKLTADNTEKGSLESEPVQWPVKTGFKKAVVGKMDGNELHADITFMMPGNKKPRFFKTFRKQGWAGNWELADPVITIKLIRDSVAMNMFDNTTLHGNNYYYYIQPTDMYGNLGPCSDTTGIFTSQPKDLPLPYLFKTKYDNRAKKVKISWKLDNPFTVSKMELYRSHNFDKGFELLSNLSAFDTSYNDVTAKPMTRYYYYFMVYDQIGRKSVKSAVMYSLLEDFTAPNKPYISKIEPTEKGIKMHIFFDTNNIAGFYIFRSIGHDTAKRIQVSPLQKIRSSEMDYTDTGYASNTAYGYTYFAKCMNTTHILSGYSNPQFAQPLPRVSKLPKVTDLMINFNDSFATFIWSSLHNLEPGIVGYNIYRRAAGSSKWDMVNKEKITGIRCLYSDSIESGNWEYTIKAVHVSGAEGEIGNIVKVNNSKTILPPNNLLLAPTDKGIQIQWHSEANPLIKSFRIYKITDGKVAKIGEVRNTEFQFLDTDATAAGYYEYYIAPVLENGKEGTPSANKSINLE